MVWRELIYVCTLTVPIVVGCGRIGYDLMPTEAVGRLPGDAAAVDDASEDGLGSLGGSSSTPDATVEDAGSGSGGLGRAADAGTGGIGGNSDGAVSGAGGAAGVGGQAAGAGGQAGTGGQAAGGGGQAAGGMTADAGQQEAGPAPNRSCVNAGPPCLTFRVQRLSLSNDKPGDTWMRPTINLINQSGETVALSELTVRYWYIDEAVSSPTFACNFAPFGTANVAATFDDVSPPRAGADAVATVAFLSAAGTLAPGGETGNIQLRFGNANFENYDETNDYSYDASSSLVDSPNITLYRNGVLVWGVEPP